jgi:hypothetical protein
MRTRYEAEVTTYSEVIPGEEANYKWAVRFDNTGPEKYVGEPGYIGVTQFDENGAVKERVLLSPRQAQELRDFIWKIRKPL